MKYKWLLLLLLPLMGVDAQTYAVTIPVQELIADELTYCLLTNEAGDIVDDFFYSPFANKLVDTIRLHTAKAEVYHLTLITNYLPTRPGQDDYTEAFTYYGLQEDFSYRAMAQRRSPLFGLPKRESTYPTYELQGLKFSISKVLLPPGTALLDKQFRLRQEVATVDLRDQRADGYYLFFQRSSRESWRYLLHRPEAKRTTLQYSDLPTVDFQEEIRLPLFTTWQLDISAYHPYLDKRVGIPITENAAGLLQERDLILYIPEMDILTDYVFAARMRRPGERYTQVFRGNELPEELTRIDPFFTSNIDLTRLSVKVSGPEGYFVINGTRANVLDYPEEELTLPNSKISWKVFGEIPVTGHINFKMPVFRAETAERIPNLRRLTPQHFTHCNLVYPNHQMNTALWANRLIASQDVLHDYGGTLITKNLVGSAQ